MEPVIDNTDPAVAFLAWALTWIVGWIFSKFSALNKFRHALPTIAVLMATALWTGITVTEGGEFSFALVTRALGAGAVAVAGHSQFKELQKVLLKPMVEIPPPTSSSEEA